MNTKDLIEEVGYIVKRKAACHGGEYCSPCLFLQGWLLGRMSYFNQRKRLKKQSF